MKTTGDIVITFILSDIRMTIIGINELISV